MYKYFDTEIPKDKIYQKIMGQLNNFIENLPSEEDRKLLSKMISECYYKHKDSIKSKEKDDPRLITPLIMALLVDQQSMIDRLENNNC